MESSRTTIYVEEGDLTRLLPRLRVGELDLIVGRLEPGYASPDLQTEALYEESMAIVAHPDHPLCAMNRPTWNDLAKVPWVVPPSWASSRIKLNQMFYKHKLHPPSDIVETASYLATLSFMRARPAIAFLARAVALQCEQDGLLRLLPVKVPIELPSVGVISVAGAIRTPSTEHFLRCLRQSARG